MPRHGTRRTRRTAWGPARLHGSTPWRPARHLHVCSAKRRWPNRRHAFDLRGTRLPGHRPRARLARRRTPRRIRRDLGRCRGRCRSPAGAHRRHHPGAGIRACHRGTDRARSTDDERRPRDPQSFRPRRQGHGHLLPPALIFILSKIGQNEMPTSIANSTRIAKRFAELRASGELGIIAYVTAGDPSLDATLGFVLALAEAGADVIELGIPFSDPLADGPTIQRASERALKAGTTLVGVLDLVRRIRESSLSGHEVPLVLLGY